MKVYLKLGKVQSLIKHILIGSKSQIAKTAGQTMSFKYLIIDNMESESLPTMFKQSKSIKY